MRAKLILFAVLNFLHKMPGNAQGIECATDYIHYHSMQTDSTYKKRHLSFVSKVDSLVMNQSNNKFQSTVYVIPVVVHVIHLGELIGTGSNISDTQIKQAIDGLNDRFRNEIGSGQDSEIEFCLASRDPDGYSTTGINRVDGSGVPNYQTNGIQFAYSNCEAASEASIKDLSKWPVSDYYNIWVVNNICQGFGGFVGFAHYPNGSPYDGTVILANAMTYDKATLAHELGHGFFLFHTFQGDGGNAYCPEDTLCLVYGDGVCDTPPHKQYDCGLTNPCTTIGIWDNSRYNYMSYCLKDRFTQGQVDRMRATAIVAPRASLVTSNGCTLGIAEDYSFTIFPNPSHDIINLQSRDSIYRILITNIIGEIVYYSESGDTEIDLQSQAKGVYFIECQMKEEKFSKKLILQ